MRVDTRLVEGKEKDIYNGSKLFNLSEGVARGKPLYRVNVEARSAFTLSFINQRQQDSRLPSIYELFQTKKRHSRRFIVSAQRFEL
jgi:hypothetical protein